MRSSRVHPFHLLAALAAVGAVFIASGSLSDIDLYWHVPLGADIVHHHHGVSGAGQYWVLNPRNHGWKTTEWLFEVGSYGLYALGGYAAIHAYTVVTAAITVALIARATFRGIPNVPARALVFSISVITLAVHLEDRAATISLAILAALMPYLLDLLRGARIRHTIALAVLGLVWANIHGYWVMLPGLLVLVAIARAADRQLPLVDAMKPANQALIVAIAACVNPHGPSILTAPGRLHSATFAIAEWQPTSIADIATWGMLGVLGLVFISWARSQGTVPWSEVVFVLGLSLFSVLAVRNVIPALVVMTPIAADRLAHTLHVPAGRRSDREVKLLRIAFAAILVVGVGAITLRAAIAPAVPHSVPRHLLSVLASQPGEHRVLDEYNVSGETLAFGGDNLKLAVDGRADYYGADYLHRYLNLMQLGKDWQRTLAGLDVNYAVLSKDLALTYELRQRGWSQLSAEDGYVLLRAPHAAAGTGS